MEIDNINKLLECKTKCEVIKTLQEIGKQILSRYIIKLDDNSYLIPIWIEAYCYIENNFEDIYADGYNAANGNDQRRRQGRNNNCQYYGNVERHWNKEYTNLHFSHCPKDINSDYWRRARVDIVPIHDNSFALSYLLKLCIHANGGKKELLIQSGIAKLLKDKSVELVTIDNSTNRDKIKLSRRVGINDEYDLAFFSDNFESSSYEKIRNNRKSQKIETIIANIN